MKFKRTILFSLVVFSASFSVYYFDYRKEENKEQQKEIDSQILKFDENQINMLEITKKGEKIVIHKSEKGWVILEPIQDKADNEQIEDLIKSLVNEKMLVLAKEAENFSDKDLSEYGLDNPIATYNIKNNLGQSKKISIGTQKNFEGNSYIRMDSENKIYVANSVWFNKAENKMIYYREKRLYRELLSEVVNIKVSSLQNQFELKRIGTTWASTNQDQVLDQNKVREALRKIAETQIQDYVFDGEPSSFLIDEKGLNTKPSVHIEFSTAETSWSVNININESQNAVYGLTDRPTRLVKLDPSSWEFFGNLSLDSMRDRVSVTRFNIERVKKVFVKYKDKQFNFVKTDNVWKPIDKNVDASQFNLDLFNQAIKKIHDLEISEFIDKKQVDQFKGHEMIILKSEDDNLVYQLNWGPLFKMKKNGKEKDYYYARTQASPSIFALDKERIESFGIEKFFLQKESH
jgi:hypothetical protein